MTIADLIELTLEKGPEVAIKKAQKDFVMFAAHEFENQVSSLMEPRRQKKLDPKPRPKAAKAENFKRREPEIIDAEIVDSIPHGAITI